VTGRWAVWAAYACSAAAHLALFAWVARVQPVVRARDDVAVELQEVAPPTPVAAPVPPPPETKPEPIRPVRPVVQARPTPALAPDPTPPPPVAAAPPPNAPPPPDAPPPAKAPVRIGLTLSSTTQAGGFAAPVGNTLYGKAAEKAEDPATAKPYLLNNYAPPAQVTTLPEPIEVSIPKQEYPEEARRLGLEGEVKLRLIVDDTGRVRDARIIEDPGHGFGERAVRIALAYFRFRPARRGADAVATEIPFTLRFELP
jgi:protein TonB